MNTIDEVKQIQKLRKGDATAFRTLYNAWSGRLYNFVMSISAGDTYLAEEMVQSVFSSIWEKRKDLDHDKSFGAFLCTIAKNRLTNHYRHLTLEMHYQKEYQDKKEEGESTTEQDVDYHLLKELVDRLMERLPPSRKKVYQLSKQHHFSNKEIAKKLNISEKTVQSQITKANLFIRNQLLKRYDIGTALLFYLLTE